MQKLFSSSSITNQPPTSRSIQPPGFAGKPSPSALPIASQTRPFRNETGGSEQLPPMLERDRFVPSSRFSLEPRYSSSTTLPTSRDSFYASGYHNGGTHPNPTKVFVSLELPKELMAATSSFSSPASETAPRRSLPLTGYNGVRDSFSLEANSMTPPAHARQQGRGGLPFLSDPPHVVQLHRAELERLNRREVDGEGRPVVSKAAGMRAGLLQEFLKGSPGSSRIGSLAGSKRGSFLNDSGSSEERTSTVSSGNGLGNLNSVSNLSDPDRTGSRVIETMLRNSKTMREEAERYVPSVLEGGDMRGSRGLPQSRCQIQLEKISNSRSSHVTLNDSSIQIGCESGSTSSSLPCHLNFYPKRDFI
ncbi:hypothetical protein BC830DRAFT_1081448 [Chytriomyces sp. MP71]|nr:hypothetical protein BC830DRAFT_1081448 [Chytriomyces sp. MP71]